MGKKEPPPIIDADFEIVSGPDRPVQREPEPGEAVFNAIVPRGLISGGPIRQVVLAAILTGMLLGAFAIFQRIIHG